MMVFGAKARKILDKHRGNFAEGEKKLPLRGGGGDVWGGGGGGKNVNFPKSIVSLCVLSGYPMVITAKSADSRWFERHSYYGTLYR